MIYFGFAGWGPWNTWNGSIWFLTGMVAMALLRQLFSSLDKRNVKAGLTVLLINVLLLWFGAAIGGYYAWFNGALAQYGTDQEDCRKRIDEFRDGNR